jgi:outer membrane lipoprotein SlyB
VAAIEVVPRQSASSSSAGAVGAAAVGGSGGSTSSSGTGADRVYRVTLHMDDGSTQVVTQETTPDFRTGDRVNLSGGAIAK